MEEKMDEENRFFMKILVVGRGMSRAVFHGLGKIVQLLARILIGEANQNGRSREVNS